MTDTELVLFDRARLALAEAVTITEVKHVRDQAEALRLYYRQSTDGLEMQNQCAAIKLRAERRMGLMLAVIEKHKGGKPNLSQDVTGSPATLEELGVRRMQSSRWQKVGKITEVDLEGYISRTIEEGDSELSTAGLLRRPDAALRQSEGVEWYTPPQYIESAREVLGKIDLDPASSPQANKVVKADEFFDKNMNGLDSEWYGTVWLNPPYGGLSGDFTGKLLFELDEHRTQAAILLINANSTDTQWFQPLWNYVLCFTDHRLNFISPDGEGSGSTHGSVFVYMGNKEGLFIEKFKQYGTVVKRVS